MDDRILALASFASGELKQFLRSNVASATYNGQDVLMYSKKGIEEKIELINTLFLPLTEFNQDNK